MYLNPRFSIVWRAKYATVGWACPTRSANCQQGCSRARANRGSLTLLLDFEEEVAPPLWWDLPSRRCLWSHEVVTTFFFSSSAFFFSSSSEAATSEKCSSSESLSPVLFAGVTIPISVGRSLFGRFNS